MSTAIPIAFIEIRVFTHATEDPDKVITAARNLLPPELADKIIFKKTSQTGHYGNPITLIETRIKERNLIKSLLEKLGNGLSSLDKEQLSNEITQHLDKGKLFIRLDKQSAFLGEFKLASSDPMHLRIQFKKSDLQEIVNICKRFGMLP